MSLLEQFKQDLIKFEDIGHKDICKLFDEIHYRSINKIRYTSKNQKKFQKYFKDHFYIDDVIILYDESE